MKAIEINGKIKTFNRLPKSWDVEGTTILNFNKLSDKEAEDYGFYDVVTPEYDSRIEKLDNLHLDGDVYTYDVVDKDIPQTLAELKEQKISNLKSIIGSQLGKTDWYNDRKLDEGIDMPAEILEQRIALRKQSNDVEAEIKALTTKKSVILFDLPNFMI